MRLGEVLKKERERRGLTVDDAALRLQRTAAEVSSFENGSPELERWGPAMGRLAVALRTPTSRLVSPSGRSDDLRAGGVGALVASAREAVGVSLEELAESAALTPEELVAVEAGRSVLEELGPYLLRFAELVEIPVFNLFFPCGVPIAELEDYP